MVQFLAILQKKRIIYQFKLSKLSPLMQQSFIKHFFNQSMKKYSILIETVEIII